MKEGPLFIKRQTAANSSYPMICSGYQNSSFEALSKCTVPTIRTKQTMPASCRPEESSPAELAYTCQLTGSYIQKTASNYSMKFCEAGPRGSEARVDKVCVARASCTRRQATVPSAFEKTRSWPNVYPSYVVCRTDVSGKCGLNADDCRSDKTLYFTNEKRGESLIRVDVGLDLPHAPAPVSAAPVARTTDVWRTTPLPEPPPPAPRANQPSAVVVDENGDWATPASAPATRTSPAARAPRTSPSASGPPTSSVAMKTTASSRPRSG